MLARSPQRGSSGLIPGPSGLGSHLAAGPPGLVSQDLRVVFYEKYAIYYLPRPGEIIIVRVLLGTPHDMTIPIQVHMDGSKTTAKAQFVIPYVQWGLENPSFMIWNAENDCD
jgi:hypothetical protein